MLPELAAWTSQASHCIGECFDAAKPMLDAGYAGLPHLARFVCAQLFIDCNLSSESALLLTRAEKEWDADLITRSIMEGSFKFTYMLEGSNAEIEEKANEYWHVLPLFYRIKHGENVSICPTPTLLSGDRFKTCSWMTRKWQRFARATRAQRVKRLRRSGRFLVSAGALRPRTIPV